MAGEGAQSDFWDVLDEAEMTVERWPPWQQEYEPDIFYGEDVEAKSSALWPAVR